MKEDKKKLVIIIVETVIKQVYILFLCALKSHKKSERKREYVNVCTIIELYVQITTRNMCNLTESQVNKYLCHKT